MLELKLGLEQWFSNFGFSDYWANLFCDAIFFISLLLISYIANFIIKKLTPLIVTRLVRKTKTNWDDIMLKRKVFTRLSHLAPILIIYYGIPNIFPEAPDFILLVQKSVRIYLVFWIALIINSFLHSLNDIYESYDSAAERPIKGYIQVVQIIVYVLAVVVMISIIMNKSVTYLFAGIGTMSAVLMIIFKDGLLGLTAGIQMSINKTVRIGDWISVPAQNADGTVVEITLNNIKVKNFDNTITVIPSYAFVSGSFQNWRGMQESGGRRIKRAILIDQTSIKFCTKEMLERFKKIELISEYITERTEEIEEYNSKNMASSDMAINGRRMTNIGTYRKYVTEYLQNHPMVNTELTAMVRQLAPTEKGIPLELYFFSKEKRWVFYEGIQADIFDHLLASIETFELRVFQAPSGHDMRQLVK
ncbi:MAG: mechanosensitive ion channel family protein [Salinivirgaceae bacterium]|jgi:miniconductance mechanosensitive channel|nr:mechanosensitive ion channel [Bacteroidales bacterium]